MRRALIARPTAIAALAALALLGGCNDVGDCPSKSAIVPGGSCSGNSLECAYDLATPSPACDGTNTTLATSCICTKGSWACPSPVSCPAPDAGAGDDATGGNDGSPGQDGSNEANTSDSGAE